VSLFLPFGRISLLPKKERKKKATNKKRAPREQKGAAERKKPGVLKISNLFFPPYATHCVSFGKG
jgi:hypothetical protein